MASPLPSRADIAGTPSNAQAKAALTAEYDYLEFLFGADGTPEQARGKLGIGSINYRNLLINGRFVINQLAKSGTVVLAAGAYGHDGWKAGPAGCTYTFAKAGNLTTITITAGTLQQVVDGRKVDGGNYVMSWAGTAQGRIGAGAYGSNVVGASGVTAAANQTVEFNTGTLTSVQFEAGTIPSIYEAKQPLDDWLQCREYYQTSYQGQAPGTVTQTGRLITLSSSTSAYAAFAIPFYPTMRATPTLTIYNPATGVTGSMYNESAGTNFGVTGLGSPFVSPNFAAVQAGTAPPASATMTLHYAADARL
jgi:hypothetical protein